MPESKHEVPREPFRFKFTYPFDSYQNGQPPTIPYVVDGLLTQAGFSILGGKPKSGKSSLSRYLAVCVAKGKPFLGRSTTQGEVMIVNLEDPQFHLDNCLSALGYDSTLGDREIHITDRLTPSIGRRLARSGMAIPASQIQR
jgi:hypothetical protein